MGQTKTEITMPKLAESVVSATISKWLKKPGDRIEEYEPLCEIVTDKVTSEVPCTIEGTLLEITVEEGIEVDVGTVICVVDAAGTNEASAAPNEAVYQMASESAGTSRAKLSRTESSAADQSMRKRLSPVVRQWIEEHQIDIDQLQGSGIGGRITRKDVQEYIKKGKAAASNNQPVRTSGLHLTPQAAPKVEVEQETAAGNGEYFIDVTPIRNTIATRMRCDQFGHAAQSNEGRI